MDHGERAGVGPVDLALDDGIGQGQAVPRIVINDSRRGLGGAADNDVTREIGECVVEGTGVLGLAGRGSGHVWECLL
jgi:hypothetical protein